MSGGAERRSNFFLGFLLLPRAKREALSALYAYCRLIDDIVDSGSLSKDEARRMLDFWRAEIGRLFDGKPTHSVAQALVRPIADYKIPREPFDEMIRGCALDLEGTRYETIEDLEGYMRGVASSVGVMCVHVFGWVYTPRERMMEFAQTFGYAFQLTNILRDVGADLEMGRVYLPQQEIRDCGYTVERLIHRDHGPGFDRLMEGQYRRAKTYYARARNLLDFRDRPAQLPAEIMAHVYEGLLDEIKAGQFRVLYQKTSLPGYRKAALAARALLYCYGLGY
jgi:phytoene synthase